MTDIPSEHVEQRTLMQWARLQEGRYPALWLLHAIPNGGARHKAVAAKLRAEGVRAGVPDLHLPVARGNYHGLWIEMKRRKGGSVSKAQREWLDALDDGGYRVATCKGWEHAREVLLEYLEGSCT